MTARPENRLIVVCLLCCSTVVEARGKARKSTSLDAVVAGIAGIVDAGKLAPRLLVQLKYARSDNFMKKNVYGDLRRCYLQEPAAKMLARAAKTLQRMRPDLRLLAADCARPHRVQRMMWNVVKGTRFQRYVANPRRLSMHNIGCAIDLTLADVTGKQLDMGTALDEAVAKSQPRLERKLALKGKLTAAQWSNRLLLRQVMVSAGFIPLHIEWWHFDCASRKVAMKKFPRIP